MKPEHQQKILEIIDKAVQQEKLKIIARLKKQVDLLKDSTDDEQKGMYKAYENVIKMLEGK